MTKQTHIGARGRPTKEQARLKSDSVEVLLRPFVHSAIERIVSLMQDPNSSVALKASVEILDRVYGKSRQFIDSDPLENKTIIYAIEPDVKLSLEDIRRECAEREAQEKARINGSL
jgi:hypothetical protein